MWTYEYQKKKKKKKKLISKYLRGDRDRTLGAWEDCNLQLFIKHKVNEQLKKKGAS